MKFKFLLFSLLLFSSSLWGQEVTGPCGTTFDDIELNCIKRYAKKLKPKTITIPADDIAKLKDYVGFYRTENGHYGKFIVKSYSVSRQSCVLYLDATTFQGRKILKPNSIFSIKNEFNSWEKHSLGFDETSSNDFSLSIEKGRCVLKTENASIAIYKQIAQKNTIQGSALLYNSAWILITLAAFLVLRTIFQDESQYKAQEKLEDGEQEETPPTNDIVLKYSRPFFKRYFSPIVAGMKSKKKIKEKYKRKLASSGMTKQLSPEDFFAFKLFLIIGFPIVYLGLRSFLEVEADWPLWATPILSLVGFFYPDLWISGKIAQRKKEVITNMPFVVDMLALSVEAGLDFVAAMQKVTEKAPPSALVDEFEAMIKETKIGASRAEALRQMAWRIDSLPVSSFCATLIAADSVGASIGPILKTLAGELRQKRSAEVEKAGAQAATKLLFPMIFLVLPAVVVVIVTFIGLPLMVGR